MVLAGFSDNAIDGMVDYLYHRKVMDPYLESASPQACEEDAAKALTQFYADLCRLSDMYNIKRLAEEGIRCFRTWLTYGGSIKLNIIHKALEAAAKNEDFPRDVRQLFVGLVAEALSWPHGHDAELIDDLIKDHQMFALEVLRMMAEKGRDGAGGYLPSAYWYPGIHSTMQMRPGM